MIFILWPRSCHTDLKHVHNTLWMLGEDFTGESWRVHLIALGPGCWLTRRGLSDLSWKLPPALVFFCVPPPHHNVMDPDSLLHVVFETSHLHREVVRHFDQRIKHPTMKWFSRIRPRQSAHPHLVYFTRIPFAMQSTRNTPHQGFPETQSSTERLIPSGARVSASSLACLDFIPCRLSSQAWFPWWLFPVFPWSYPRARIFAILDTPWWATTPKAQWHVHLHARGGPLARVARLFSENSFLVILNLSLNHRVHQISLHVWLTRDLPWCTVGHQTLLASES